jgi:zinc D-Ala-D-Ala carboxypeptidase
VTRQKLLRLLMALPLMIAVGAGVTVVVAGPASADGCYTWNRTLRSGMSGADVTQLQIRVAGWVASGEVLAIDGAYGAKTAAAVTRFQRGYGLAADGVAGPQTFSKLYALQDNDCTPIHFSYAEVTQSATCGSQASMTGGSVGAATVRENLKRAMWKAEALRRKMGDRPLRVTSGFRSSACNQRVSSSGPNGPHTYGYALDFVPGSGQTFCGIFNAAKSAGFAGILGPGYPGHNDHIHADGRTSGRFWSAPNC